MLHNVTFRALAVAACGWLLACDASALSLGRARGAALIGRPLDIAIPVTLDAPDGDAPCAAADLYYGENKLSTLPSVRWEPGTGGQGVLRVTSGVPVDEPMVTLYLRVGCGTVSSRRYVLLSELPPESEPLRPAPLVAPPPAGTAPRAGRTGAPESESVVRRPPPRAAVAAAAPAIAAAPERAQREAPPPQRAQAAPPAPSRARGNDAAAPRARLQLDPLDLSEIREPTLRLTARLATQVASDPQQRAAAAALWQSLQRTPEQVLQDALRLQGVERELLSLRDQTRQNAATLQQMRAQADRAQGERQAASGLVLALLALVAGVLAWLAMRWHRARRLAGVGRWFELQGAAQAPVGHAGGVDVPLDAPAPPIAARAPAAAALVATGAVAAAARKPAAAPAGAGLEDFPVSRGGAVRMVGVEELLDVHDKADFFLSIGETAQAIAVLEAHVHDQVETSALAWMDLLELYHSEGRRAEFGRLRAEFRQRFTAQVPDFDHFDQPTASLENYSRALSRIVALWPAKRVLDVIEESIFRKPGLPGAEPFSLEAYRELVLLYHVARDIAPEQAPREDGGATGFPETSLQPLNVPEPTDPGGLVPRQVPAPDLDLGERERLMVPPASARLGVDIDLADPEPPRELPALDFDMSEFDTAEMKRKKTG